MNCKPGDLAIVVKSVAGNEWKIVTCLKFIGSVAEFSGNDYWITDSVFTSTWGCVNNYCRDSWMRPIRPSDEQDEMLRIVGLPNKEKDKA